MHEVGALRCSCILSRAAWLCGLPLGCIDRCFQCCSCMACMASEGFTTLQACIACPTCQDFNTASGSGPCTAQAAYSHRHVGTWLYLQAQVACVG